MYLFGYLIATLVSGFVAFLLFQNSFKASAINALIGAVLFYVVFIRLMGVYDPAGRLINFSALLY
jgi:biotin transporter BioY